MIVIVSSSSEPTQTSAEWRRRSVSSAGTVPWTSRTRGLSSWPTGRTGARASCGFSTLQNSDMTFNQRFQDINSPTANEGGQKCCSISFRQLSSNFCSGAKCQNFADQKREVSFLLLTWHSPKHTPLIQAKRRKFLSHHANLRSDPPFPRLCEPEVDMVGLWWDLAWLHL